MNMRRNTTTYMLGAVGALMLLAVAAMPIYAAGNTATSYGEAVVTAPALAMREGPSVGFQTLTTLEIYTRVTLLGRTRTSDWLFITSGNYKGWISSRFVETQTVLSTLPVMGTSEPYAEIGTGTASIRSGPGTQYPVLTFLDYATLVSAVGRSSDRNWVQIRYETNTIGWVHAGLISVAVSVRDLPIVLPNNVPAGVTGGPGGEVGGGGLPDADKPTPEGGIIIPTPVDPVQGLPAPNATPYGGAQVNTVAVGPSGITTTTTTTTTGGEVGGGGAPSLSGFPAVGTGVLETGSANVRSGPGTQYAVLFVLPQYSRPSIAGRNAGTTWLLLVFNDGTTGWISAGVITPNVPYSSMPVVQYP